MTETEPRRWESVMASRETRGAITEEEREIRKALARIGATEDGRKLSEYLAKTVLFAFAPIDAEPGALVTLNAERRVALRIVAALNGELSDDRNQREPGDDRFRILRRIPGGFHGFARRCLGRDPE